MSFVLALVFPAAMIVAAVTDLKSMTIPNWLIIALSAVFPVFAISLGASAGAIGVHLAAGLLVLLLTFGCFAAGWMGGGDAKLLAAVALWLGPTPAFISFVIWTSVFGGVLTLAFLLARACMSPTTGLSSVDRLLRPDTGIPYGVAIGSAGLMAVPAIMAPLV